MFAWLKDIFNQDFMNSVYEKCWNFSGEKEIKELLKKNALLLNSHSSKRCYILGNGPSLKGIDLSILNDGNSIFTVNSIIRHPQYSELGSDFHFWFDSGYFNGEYEKEGVLNEIKNTVYTNCRRTTIFVPCEAKAFLEDVLLPEDIKAYYLYPYYDPTQGSELKVDITKPIYTCRTVVQLAVVVAIYMGYEEIYLLGCDGTNILDDFNSILTGKTLHTHFYDSKERFKYKDEVKITSEYVCYAQYRVYLMWRLISEYCKKNNIVLKNVIKETLIDSIEKISFCNLKKKENYENSCMCTNKTK
ncbi:MAG: DUF115 domain-containing protein [Lachnospiraceae bacterium]|nr:DUF115 domain-containing protein [Lachnospiraceae bacterium]MDD7628492.1 DUF115 domain-containing protein [Lachnospiraceae bacterium]MDY4120018.1 6-hydroxymethylpterin diphosphokinase MptE-like protein [Lachnospiraceae bacterium]